MPQEQQTPDDPQQPRAQTYVRTLIDIYTHSPLRFGVGDICSADYPNSTNRAGAFCVVMAAARSNGTNLVRRIVVVMPPLASADPISEDSVVLSLKESAKEHLGRELTEEEWDSVREHIAFVRAKDFTVPSALKALETAGKREAAIILRSASYRVADLTAGRDSLIGVSLLPEDAWVSHMVGLAKSVIDYARRIECYVLLDTGAAPPQRKENNEVLMSVDDCGLFSLRWENDDNEILATHVDAWIDEARKGHLGSVFRAIDALPEWMDSQKSFIKLQIFDRVAPGLHVISMLRDEVEKRDYIDPSSRLKLALIARRADERQLAHQLLAPAVPELIAQEELELALEIAAGDVPLTSRTTERLGLLHPASADLFEHTLKQLFDDRSYSDALVLLRSEHPPLDTKLEAFFATLACGFNSKSIPDYSNLIETVVAIDPGRADWARALCAREALSRCDFATAVELCLPTEQRPMERGTARMLISTTFQILLKRDQNGKLPITGDELAVPVAAVLNYLTDNPTDGRTRLELADLLSFETSGALGLAVLVLITLNRASATGAVPPKHSSEATESATSEIDLSSFLENAYEWMAGESPVLLHLIQMPASLLPAQPDAVFEELRDLVHHDQDLRDDRSAQAFESIVFIAALVARMTTTPNEDLDIVRYAAARFIAANRPQKGRDFAEQALHLADASPARRRLAWLAFADIYHRSHNTIESLIALACVFTAENEITVEDMWQEAYLLFRVLRDLGFVTEAASILGRLRRSLSFTASPVRYELRLVTMELGLELKSYSVEQDGAGKSLANLTNKIKAHCRTLLETTEDIAPALSLLIHCVYLARLHDFPVDVEATAIVRSALPKAPAELSDALEAVSSPTPDGHGFISLATSLEQARYYQDIAFDLAHIATAARRFLDTELSEENAQTVVLAIEALSDLAIRGTSVIGPDSTFSSPQITLNRAAMIARTGYRIVFVGMSEAGRLVRVSLVDGILPEVRIEGDASFSRERFRRWAERFPYGYGQSQDPNVFWTSTESLGLTVSEPKPTIFIMDTTLQRFPPNLLRIGDDFAGRLMPVASAPSMSWLAARALSQATEVNSGSRAWIPTDTGPEKDMALDMLAERLKDDLKAHNVTLRRDAEVPDDMARSELSIVAAHGGLLPGERYFQKVSDNVNLAIYPETLAAALQDSGVVLLFICSGGRVDSHPQAETTIGLVKQLFNYGCASVVASPWPLNVSVPPKWLPVFLKKWDHGDTVAEAAFEANRVVANSLGGNPGDYLAMNVFGDGLLRKAQR